MKILAYSRVRGSFMRQQIVLLRGEEIIDVLEGIVLVDCRQITVLMQQSSVTLDMMLM